MLRCLFWRRRVRASCCRRRRQSKSSTKEQFTGDLYSDVLVEMFELRTTTQFRCNLCNATIDANDVNNAFTHVRIAHMRTTSTQYEDADTKSKHAGFADIKREPASPQATPKRAATMDEKGQMTRSMKIEKVEESSAKRQRKLLYNCAVCDVPIECRRDGYYMCGGYV